MNTTEPKDPHFYPLLRESGFRERAFAKSHLAADGRIDDWGTELNEARYDPESDEVILYRGERRRVKVAWEGSRSLEVLAEHQVDAGDLYGLDPSDPDELDATITASPEPREMTIARQLREAVRAATVEPFVNDPMTRARAVKAISDVLREHVPSVVGLVVEPDEHLAGVFRVIPKTREAHEFVSRTNGVEPALMLVVDVSVAEIDARAPETEQVYLDDIAAAYLDAPAMTDEENFLEKAHRFACERLGVDEQLHMEQMTTLAHVKREPENLPRLVRLVSGLAVALTESPELWLRGEPWEERDDSPADFMTRLVVHVCSEAESILGYPVDGWEVVLFNLIRGELVSCGIELLDVNGVELERRIATVLAYVDRERASASIAQAIATPATPEREVRAHGTDEPGTAQDAVEDGLAYEQDCYLGGVLFLAKVLELADVHERAIVVANPKRVAAHAFAIDNGKSECGQPITKMTPEQLDHAARSFVADLLPF